MLRKGSRVVSEKDASSVRLASEVLLRGGFVVAPTDTIYGILADALNYEAVLRLQKLRRPSRRPFLLLVPDPSWVRKLGLALEKRHMRLLSLPRLTLVLKRRTKLYHWLGGEAVAVRLPRNGFVLRLLKELGRPVVAPSANLEGKPPAKDVGEAFSYFRDEVSLYIDGGRIEGKPSTILKVEGGKVKVLRSGAMSSESLRRLLESFRPPLPFLG